MHFIKSIGDGIGTAAGVAWPIFGIVSGTLSLTSAGLATIWLGALTCVLFLIVAVPVTIWSYHQFKQERRKQKCNLRNQRRLFDNHLLDYLFNTINETLLEQQESIARDQSTFLAAVKRKIRNEINHSCYYFSPANWKIVRQLITSPTGNNLLEKIIATTEKNPPSDFALNLYSEAKQQLAPILTAFYKAHHICIPEANFKLHLGRYVKTGIMSFCAAFGSLAGCGAGALGMLTGVGVFAGLAPVPIVGWMILGLAITFGLTIAAVSIYYAYKKDKKAQAIHRIEESNNDFQEINKVKKIRLATELDLRKWYHFMPQSKCEAAPVLQFKLPQKPKDEAQIVDFRAARQKMLLRNH